MNELISSFNYLFEFLLFIFIALIIFLFIGEFLYLRAKKLNKIVEIEHCRVVGKLKNSENQYLITFALFNGDYLTLNSDVNTYSKLTEGEFAWIKYNKKTLLECDNEKE